MPSGFWWWGIRRLAVKGEDLMEESARPSSETWDQRLREGSGMMIGVGALQALLGLAAVIAPQVATTITVDFLAILLCISAVAQGILASRVKGWRGTFLLALSSVASLVLGVMILRDPLGGAVAATLWMAIACLVGGAARVALGLREEGAKARGALLVGGIAGAVLGLLLLAEWPGDAVWALGLLLGIDWLVGGLGLISLGAAVRRPKSAESA